MIEFTASTLDAVELANDIAFDPQIEYLPILVFIDELDYHRLDRCDDVDHISTNEPIKITDLIKKKVVFCSYNRKDEYLLEKLEADWSGYINGDVVRVTVPLFLF